MSDLPLRYETVSPDRRSELRLLDKETLIEKVVEYESQVLFDPQVLVDETRELVEEYETRRRIIDFVEENHRDKSRADRLKIQMELELIVSRVRP